MLGDLSKKYESSGDPGAISSGYQDPGGKSYGAYQLSSNAGSVGSFLHWAINLSGNDVYQHYGTALADYEIRSSGFDAKWREIAAVDGAGFFRMQHDYICYAYYFPAVDALRAQLLGECRQLCIFNINSAVLNSVPCFRFHEFRFQTDVRNTVFRRAIEVVQGSVGADQGVTRPGDNQVAGAA